MPPHIRCILSTRCILTHSHSYAFKRIQMHSLTYAFTSVRRCIHSCMHTRVSIRMKTWMTCSGTWVLHWHALWQNGTPTARPAHTRPCEFGLESARLLSCVSMCGPWCILAHSYAFLRIHMHSCAFLSIMKRVRSRPGAHRNRVLNPPKCTGIHNNASECITGRMQHIQNAPS